MTYKEKVNGSIFAGGLSLAPIFFRDPDNDYDIHDILEVQLLTDAAPVPGFPRVATSRTTDWKISNHGNHYFIRNLIDLNMGALPLDQPITPVAQIGFFIGGILVLATRMQYRMLKAGEGIMIPAKQFVIPFGKVPPNFKVPD